MDKQNQKKGDMAQASDRDEALFAALGKNKKKRKRKIACAVLAAAAVLALALGVGVMVLRQRVRTQFASANAEVLSYEVTTGTIRTVVSGSGTLQNMDVETVEIPSGVEVTDILVSDGDWVETGALIATVDMSTVRSAMSGLQDTIEDLDEQISGAEGDKVSAYIRAGISGRVKILYAEKGSDVAGTMVEHGAVAVLSLDGLMAAEIETDALSPGETVSVLRPDGTAITGTVEYAAAGKATVLVTDNGPAFGEEVTVQTADGIAVGSGTLYIHSPLAVTGYAGTVSHVNAKENQQVYASTTLFTLTNTESSANYDALLRQRQQTEEALLELLRIQRSGGIAAPISGSVYSAADPDEENLAEAASISPDVSMSVTITVDESDILALEVGQEAEVTVSSVSEDRFIGTVTEIDKTGVSGSYTAVVVLEKVPGMLPGMTASVDVRIEGVENAVIIPADALNRTSAGAYVYTSYDEETRQYGGRVDVVTGLSNSSYVEIKSGLSVGDTVWYTESRSVGNLFGNMGGGFGGNGQQGGMPGGNGNFGGNMPDAGDGQFPQGGRNGRGG